MKITADTTDEQILATGDAWRKSLAESAVSGKTTIETLAALLNSVAEAEGAAEVDHGFRDLLQAGKGPGSAYALLIERHLLNGPDDTWSGRRNDVRRAKADGIRNRLNNLRFEV